MGFEYTPLRFGGVWIQSRGDFSLIALYYGKIHSSVQAEKKKIATTTFLDAWDLRSHMAGHFHLWHAVFSYHPGLLGPSS